MAGWKVQPSNSERTVEYTPFLTGRKYFAVDDSGSTAGAVLRKERAFVDAFQKDHANAADAMSLWGSSCDNPTANFESAGWRSNHGGTQPSEILRNERALAAIRKADVWFLLTDGEIWDGDVHRLADLAYDAEVLNVPLVFVITGSRGSSPGTANISVGISFFASSHDTLILFKDLQTGKLYVIAGKGCFAELGGSAAAQDLTNWTNLTAFASEADFFSHCEKSHIKVTKSESRASSTGHISLGSEWEAQHNGPVQVDLDALLGSGLLSDMDAFSLLSDEAFNFLAVACKTRRRIPELRTFVQGQKIEQVAPKFEDRNGAATIIAKMADTTATDDDRKKLQHQLREAHSLNRRDYQDTIASFTGSPAEQNLRKRNQLVDAALRSLASIESASYNAEIIGRSNRARRAEAIDSTTTIDIAELDLEAPSYKGYCLICCGEDEIMSVCLKDTDPANKEDNTSDFALNFPLAAGASAKNIELVSSQNVCFQCALLGPDGMSIYKEPLAAIIPTVQYDGSNKKYINNQLYSVLTARLATGAAGVAQLFMSILMGVMRTKSWAGATMDSHPANGEHQEAGQRRDMFQWMLNQVVGNTRTRETFNETGEWVKFPQALSWAARDFESNGLASFAVTYPMAGFDCLIALGQHTDEFSNDTVSRLKSAKLLYSVAAKYLADLQVGLQRGPDSTSDTRESWKQKYLELIYRDFNGPLVPTDQGEASILSDVDIFQQRLSACLTTSEHNSCGKDVMRKIQVLVFWLLFTQRSHCTAQTFFTRISRDEHLAPAVLNPDLTVPASEYQNILLSIFAHHEAVPINPVLMATHKALIPFANPFGASVTHCGAPNCSHTFINAKATDPTTVTPQMVELIRRERTKHLIDVFGIQGRFERSDTGLPERPVAGQPPTSIHSNMHISIVREWIERSQDARRAIVAGDACVEFVRDVRKRLCAEGRGDIFNAHIEQDVAAALPSFFDVLTAALRAEGRSDEDVALYEHNMEDNKLQKKIIWELALAAMQ
ncbi:hypothetical protein E8E13_006137 [Curvularia kusanoi]|uniref:Uncharacterized protein n=1 Tax=Curvularia kusanoi TaxID=90978 RepID=A0A9P4WCK7_CURKU|nr:hypothetical protein E8E13_006137 [Curvularia kusanoi]